MTGIDVIQFQDDAPAGLVEPWATQRGLALRVHRPDRGDALPPPGDVGAAIVLGCERSVNDTTVPFNERVRAWVAGVLGAGTPTLGICFGAQVMARALGATVARMASPEIGWVTVDGDAHVGGPWFAWHEDAIEPVAPLRVVATNPRGVQAFTVGDAAHQLGVQFHPEVTPAIVADWERTAGRDGTLAAQTVEQAATATAAVAQLLHAWWAAQPSRSQRLPAMSTNTATRP